MMVGVYPEDLIAFSQSAVARRQTFRNYFRDVNLGVGVFAARSGTVTDGEPQLLGAARLPQRDLL